MFAVISIIDGENKLIPACLYIIQGIFKEKRTSLTVAFTKYSIFTLKFNLANVILRKSLCLYLVQHAASN